MNRFHSIASALVASFALSTSASAGGTRTFKVEGFEDLDEGETKGAAIDSSGRVVVGLHSERAAIEPTTAFTCKSGQNAAYVGTADKAFVLKLSPRGKVAKQRASAKTPAEATFKVDKFAELDGIVVSAIAIHPDGDLLAATLPGGKLH